MRLSLLLCLFLLTLPTSAQDDTPLTYAYTYHQPTGNRFVPGQGTFPETEVIDFSLDNPIRWVGGAILNDEPVWITVNQNGGMFNFSEDGLIEEPEVFFTFEITHPLSLSLPIDSGGQFIARSWDGSVVSTFSHALWIGGGAEELEHIYVYASGHINRIAGSEGSDFLSLNALPDARIVVNPAGQFAVYTGADDQRYTHGVLGDSIEATELTVLEIVDNQLEVITTITLPEPDVFEGLSPIWADVDEDGADDLIVTVSNAQVGAQIRVYRVDGSLLAAGPAIGIGGRWRHQLAFGPFGPNGEMELVDVLTPHIGGVVEFYRLNGDQLEIVASLLGYTSHVIGTRNLDMAVGGDFNGDGQPEIVLPTQDRQFIAGLQHTADGVQEVWRLPLDGRLSTNLSAVTLPDDTLALAAGTEDGRLRVWMSG